MRVSKLFLANYPYKDMSATILTIGLPQVNFSIRRL